MHDFLRLRGGRIFAALGFSLLFMWSFDAFTSDAANSSAGDVVSLAFDDWTLKCVTEETGDSSPRCEISQVVAVDDETRKVEILNLAVSRSRDQARKEAFTLVALTPADIHLPSDFGLSVDDVQLSLSRYRNCNQQGCFVIIPLSGQAIKRLKRGREGAALFRDLAGRVIKITFSLKGFTKAFDSFASGVVPASDAGEKS